MKKQVYKFQYSFAIDGGHGTIPLRGMTLPDNFIMTNTYFDVVAALTGGALCTAALTTGEGAGDLVVAAVVTGVPWSTQGPNLTLNTMAVAPIKLTAARTPALVQGVTDLTAGMFDLYVEGIQGA